MAFLFPPESAARLDSVERLRRTPIQSVLRCLPLRPGMRFVDVGCGTGTYFFPVFEAMEGEGVFVGVELQEDMLRLFLNRLDTYSAHPRYTRMEAARAKPDRLPLPDSSADVVLLCDVWHEIQDRPRYLRELKRVLSPGGTLCLIDWRTPAEEPALLQDPSPMGPPFESRLSEALALDEMEAAGFRWVVSHSGFLQHWCLTAKR